jgi:hypothetical protein
VDDKGQPADANVMLTMYDASLDAFETNDWNLAVHRSHYIPYSQVRANDFYDSNRNMHWHNFDVWTYKLKNYSFSQLDMKYFQIRSLYDHRLRGFVGGYTKANALASGMVLRDAALAKSANENASMDATEMEEGEETDFSNVDIRFDFQETAFFMPQLKSQDGKGYSITFTMPQSLTTWRLNGIAHTKDMLVGAMTDRIVARKALMSKLHLPRFVREGDNLSFSASLTNTTDHQQKGKMQIIVAGALSHLVASMIIKSIGLYQFYGWLVLVRIPLYLCIAPVEIVIICTLLKRKSFARIVGYVEENTHELQ